MRYPSAKDHLMLQTEPYPATGEGDLIQGSKNSCIVSLVERHSRFVMLVKIRDNKTITVISALIKQARGLPVELDKTLTWDRGVK